MLEKRVILIQFFGVFCLILVIFGLSLLQGEGFIPKNLFVVSIFLAFLVCFVLILISIISYQRRKIFKSLIEDELKQRGLKYISERPLNFGEAIEGLSILPSFSLTINGMTINQWKNSFKFKSENSRIFRVKNAEAEYEIRAVIKTLWNTSLELEIKKSKKLAVTNIS